MAVHQFIQLYKSDVFWVELYQVACSHGGSCIWLYTRLYNCTSLMYFGSNCIRLYVPMVVVVYGCTPDYTTVQV